jgi:hypothetical protein
VDNERFLVSTCKAVGGDREVDEDYRIVPEATLQAVVGAGNQDNDIIPHPQYGD